jgi:hypothetical protein
VVIVDDCSFKKIVLPTVMFPIDIIRLENKITTNSAPIFNIGIQQALNQKADVIILQSPECYHVGDVISYATSVGDNEYIAFGCFRLDMVTTFQNHDIDILTKKPYIDPIGDPGVEGITVWWNHPIYSPNGFHWCTSITAGNLIKLNGFDESFSFGYAREDGYFIKQINELGLGIKITEYPFVVHQWHTKAENSEDKDILVRRNQFIYEKLMLKPGYRAKHILTDDLTWEETGS